MFPFAKAANRLQGAFALFLLTLVLVVCSGCTNTSREPGQAYAEPNDWNGRNSVAGSSVFKNLLTDQGFRIYKFSGLSGRSRKLDAIIWFPTDIETPSLAAMAWFDAWLAQSPDRVLIYMGRDCNPVEEYWKLAAANASPRNATDFYREAALASAEMDQMRNSIGEISFSRWFIVDNRYPPFVVKSWKGEWADESQLVSSSVTVHSRLVPVSDFSKDELNKFFADQKTKQKARSNTVPNPAGGSPQNSTPSASASPNSTSRNSSGNDPQSESPVDSDSTETMPFDSDSDDSESSDASSSNSTDGGNSPPASSPPANSPASPPQAKPLSFRWFDGVREVMDWETEKTHYSDYNSKTLLAADDDSPFIFEVTKPQWQNSRILVVGNASPFLNLGMTDANNRRLASVLAKQLSGADRVGIVVSPNSISVDDGTQDDRERPFGLLTTWPLNLITLHAAFFGLLILVALFPSFGRPRAIPTPSTQDFGDHIQALGELMYSTGDRGYALHAVANYFRTVKGESSNPWAHVDAPAPDADSSHPPQIQTEQNNTNKVVPLSGDKS
jgi:hypothetical protein